MNRKLASLFVLALCWSSCSPTRSVVYSTSGYEMVLVDANSALHKSGRLEIWDVSNPSKKMLIWPQVIGEPQFHSNTVVFSAALSEERRWQYYPAVLAYDRGSVPMDVTELISKACVVTNGLSYRAIRGAYRFKPDIVRHEGLFSFSAAKLPEVNAPGPFHLDVTVSPEEVNRWLRLAHRGTTNNYEGSLFFVPEVPD